MADVTLTDRLCNASARGDLSEVLFLLESGADVNGFNTYKRTALQVAKQGNSALIKVLLEAGANPNLPDPACGLTVMHDAAREGYIDSVRVLLGTGQIRADTNLLDWRGNLPLHLAAAEGHVEVVRLLIGRTANPQMQNDQGFTPRQLAVLRRRMETVQCIDQHLGSMASRPVDDAAEGVGRLLFN